MSNWNKPDASGTEHHVWFYAGRAWKIAYSPKTVLMVDSVEFHEETSKLGFAADTSVASYDHRCEWTNRVFPLSDIRKEGSFSGRRITPMAIATATKRILLKTRNGLITPIDVVLRFDPQLVSRLNRATLPDSDDAEL